MKIVVVHNISGGKEPYISLRPDNAVLRNNDDFYMPHFSSDMVCGSGIVVRISRLAKCIAPKFASRCYDGVTAGVTFVARDVMQRAIDNYYPTDEAYSFDRSTAIGTEWFTPEQITAESVLSMTIGGNVQNYTDSDLQFTIDKYVSFASQKLTLKTGDLLFIANDINVEVKQGDNICVTLNNIQPLNFQIK
jgi:2-keto-4-pentenoate hydratase/2-oxohepta-3-ene-1,7-dioic acid hydratase in catechol pathway